MGKIRKETKEGMSNGDRYLPKKVTQVTFPRSGSARAKKRGKGHLCDLSVASKASPARLSVLLR